MDRKYYRILNLAESAVGQTHPIITARSRSNLFSSWSLRSRYSSILSPAYFFASFSSLSLKKSVWKLAFGSIFDSSLPDFSPPTAFLSWCLSAEIVEKYAQRFVSFWSCIFVPPVTIWPDLAFKETAVSSFSKSREHCVRSSILNSTGPLVRELYDFQSASIVGSFKIRATVDSSILRTSSRSGRSFGSVWRDFEIYQTVANQS